MITKHICKENCKGYNWTNKNQKWGEEEEEEEEEKG